MSTRADVLIAVDELPAALAAGGQLLDVRWRLGERAGAGFDRYLQGHLPDARFLDLEAVLTGPTTDPTLGRHPLPGIDQLGAGLGALGIDPALPIVVYDEPGSFAAGRAWWVLRWAGLDVRVLDGGIAAWVAAGNLLETEEPPSAFGPPLALTPGHLPTLDADGVAAFDGTLIDVRAPERYRGEVEPIDAKAGHVPGAVNRPVGGYWTSDGTLPGESELRGLLALPLSTIPEEGAERPSSSTIPEEGAERPSRRVAVYCGSGVSAAQVVLALASIGVDAALYPPSWSGWSADPTRPVAVGTQA
ncbi:MAG TPA: sulfurtransferase [Propionicimonas sp.]|nr:sulfurtransferase [Propionicimonas sp.]